ncbi:MFS transporter [Sporosarcina soli]|uniref:MFS transporter n=1 Tax=Sporosarcina soli TaxID=334736 RepID=A0ABW0TMU5_9BACL
MNQESEVVENDVSTKKMGRRALVGSTVGTIIEWYDFFLYATASALIFPKLFFSDSDPYVATLLSFATFAVGFLARPVGAIIFGHFGDRVGRKNALVITLWIMGLSSFLMGVLPTYATIGFLAPLMLVILRLLQGIGVGGEWAGSVLLAMEWGNKKKQGFTASVPNAGVGAGMLLSSAVVGLCIAFTGDNFYVWGWRIPFIASLLLLLVGMVIRLRILETPSFRKVEEGNQVSKMPVLEVLRFYPKQVIYSAMAKMSEHAPFAIFTTFMINYSINNFKVESEYMVNANTFASILMCINIPLFGYLSDKIGIKKMYMIGVIATILWAFPYIGLMSTGVPVVILLATILSMFPHNIQAGAQPALISQAFPARLRYSGASLGTQIPAVFAGGIAPLVCTYLIQTTGTLYSIGFYIVFVGLISLIGTILLKNISQVSEEVSIATNYDGHLSLTNTEDVKA